MENNDIFINQKIYPQAENVFIMTTEPIERIIDKCIFVIDTNALLIPYKTSSKSLIMIKKVYSELIKQKRVIIPGQVAREFAKQRPERIKDLFQQLRDKKISISTGRYPLLEDDKDYQEALRYEKELNELLFQYKEHITNLMNKIKKWAWSDPVSNIYRELFTPETVLDISINKDKIKDELERRYKHRIPPGYKDKSKPDDGIGDLLIWFTILEIGEKQNKDVVFVSGEEKSDWFYRSAGQVLYPRFELINEFKQHSKENSFHILEFSEFLKLTGADEEVVKEIEHEEIKSQVSSSRESSQSFKDFHRRSEIAVYNWLRELYRYKNKMIEIHEDSSDIIDIEIVDGNRKIGIAVRSFAVDNITSFLLEKFVAFESFSKEYSPSKIYDYTIENNFDEFIYVFVFPRDDFDVNSTKAIIQDFLGRFMDGKRETVQLSYYLGYMVDDKFIAL